MLPESLNAALVRIRTIDGGVVGAGFLVGEHLILTCTHVIMQALGLTDLSTNPPLTTIALDFPLLAPRIWLAARIVFWNPVEDNGGGDIAGLELLGDPPAGAEAVRFTPAEDVWEHNFRAFGFPSGYDDGVWATGRILGRQATNWLLLEDIKTEGFAIAPGFSGGPVWDTRLQGVIGMVVASSQRTETKTAFVIPFDVLSTAWPRLQPITRPHVFLSSAPADITFAQRLSADLQARGTVVWDKFHELPDTNVDTQVQVRQAIRATQVVLLVVSSQTHTSRAVKEHLRLANLYQRRLLLVWIGDDNNAQSRFAGWQDTIWVDAQSNPYEIVLTHIETSLNQSQDRSLATLLEPSEKRPEQAPRNPYKGLHPFTIDDAGDFFGRERLVNELINDIINLLTAKSPDIEYGRCLTIIGPSGSGKSSVVMAGLLPQLRHCALPGSDTWVYLEPMIPSKHPIEALVRSLKPHFPDTSFKALYEDLEDDTTRGLHLLATQLVKKRSDMVVLLVDQFEEIFTQTESERERQQFIDLLLTATTESSGPLLVLLTLRADFYDRPMKYPSLSRLIQSNQRQVLQMDVADLRATIERPATLSDVQLSFEGNLVGDLLFEIQGQTGALPLLQFTLYQLFERQDEHRLTLQAYHDIGGVKGALSQHAEKTYETLPSEDHRHLARTLFLRLMEPGTSEQDTTRRRAILSEFILDDPIQTRLMRETIDVFIDARLLMANEIAGTTTLEVSHEAVLREWKRLGNWLHGAYEDIRFQQTFSNDVTEWEQHKRHKDRLYRGAQLKEAQRWTKRNRPSKREITFLKACRTRQTLSFMSITFSVLLVISLTGVAGWYVFFQPKPTLVTTLQDNGVGSLRWCIENASSNSTIKFAQGMKGIIELTGGDMLFVRGRQLTIIGPGANQLAISGGNIQAEIHVPIGSILNLSNLSFKNSEETGGDAFIYNEGTLTLNNSVISGNKTISSNSSYGGGIENSNTGVLIVNNSIISNNSVNTSTSSISDVAQGGGIENDGRLTLVDSTISNNSVNSKNAGLEEGGGIFNDGDLEVRHSIFSNNSVNSGIETSYGGAISNFSPGTVLVTNSTFSGNLAYGQRNSQGGAIYNESRLNVNKSIFYNNSANSNINSFGGAIGNSKLGAIVLTTVEFSGNLAHGQQNSQGGAIDNDGKLSVINSTFSTNSTGTSSNGFGGGISNYSTGAALIINSTFSNNLVRGQQNSQGGAIDNDGKLSVINSTFANNSTNFSNKNSLGGGIASINLKGMFTSILFCTFYGNTSSTGGGIWINLRSSRHLIIGYSIFAANKAHKGLDISGVLTSEGYNLLTSFANITGLDTKTDKKVTLSNLKLDPTLRKNGGLTQTLALLLGSSAIDAIPRQACSITIADISGHNMTITTDQRNTRRPDESENACDIGAYESSY